MVTTSLHTARLCR